MSLNKIKIITVGLAFVLLGFGLMMSQYKPLWSDEFYSLLGSIESCSYVDIITGKISEGNNTPLFYLGQKVLIDLTGYQPPQEWGQGLRGYQHRYSHVLLRVLPIACMFGGVILIFYFFSCSYSIWAGLYSLVVSLSSFMVWAYGFEARPYALWFLLTTVQAICFLSYVQNDKENKKIGVLLMVAHLLLALTVTLSLIQITAVCLLWWFLGYRRWQPYIGLWLIPAMVVIFYYMHATHLNFKFVEGIMGIIGASFPQDRLLILGFFGFFWFFTWGSRYQLWPSPSWFKLMTPSAMHLTAAYGVFTVLVFTGCVAILMILKLKESTDGFQISNRYFICLAPLCIIATTLFSYYIVQSQKGMLKAVLLIGLLIILAWRVLRTAALVGTLHLFSI